MLLLIVEIVQCLVKIDLDRFQALEVLILFRKLDQVIYHLDYDHFK